MRLPISALAITLLVFTNAPSIADPNNTEPYYSQRAAAIGNDFIIPEKFEFTLNNYRYELTDIGNGTRISGQSRTSFELPLVEFRLETVQYFSFDNDLVVLFSDHDGENSKSVIVRFNHNDMRPRWVTKVYAFNVGQALVKEKFAYLTTLGFVGKLDLNSGKFIWKHENLYKNGSPYFNNFERPYITDGKVYFREVGNVISYTPKEKIREGITITVDDKTGKILSQLPK